MSGRRLGPRPRPTDLDDTGSSREAGRSPRRGRMIALRADLLAILILALVGAMSFWTPEDRKAAAGAGSGRPVAPLRGPGPAGYPGRGAVLRWPCGRDRWRRRPRHRPGSRSGHARSVARRSREHAICALAFSPRGPTLAAGYDDSSVVLWDVAAGREQSLVRGHAGPVRCLAFSPDGATLATGGLDQSIRLWDVASGRTRAVLPGHRGPVSVLSFGPDGRSLASGCARGQIKLWDLTEAGGRERFGPPIQVGPVRGLSFSRDGTTLASACINDRIRLWDSATGRERGAFDVPRGIVQVIGFDRGGQRVLALTDWAMIPVWDIATGRALRRHPRGFRGSLCRLLPGWSVPGRGRPRCQAQGLGTLCKPLVPFVVSGRSAQRGSRFVGQGEDPNR